MQRSGDLRNVERFRGRRCGVFAGSQWLEAQPPIVDRFVQQLPSIFDRPAGCASRAMGHGRPVAAVRHRRAGHSRHPAPTSRCLPCGSPHCRGPRLPPSGVHPDGDQTANVGRACACRRSCVAAAGRPWASMRSWRCPSRRARRIASLVNLAQPWRHERRKRCRSAYRASSRHRQQHRPEGRVACSLRRCHSSWFNTERGIPFQLPLGRYAERRRALVRPGHRPSGPGLPPLTRQAFRVRGEFR